MKGFKPTGNGPKSGHSFSSKKGFSGSTGRVQNVRGYTRSKPKFAAGGAVDSSVTRRTQPVTQFDAEHGGKSPLRPGFGMGGRIAGMVRNVGRAAPARVAPAPVKSPPRGNAGPIKNFVSSAMGQGTALRGNHGYGSFGRRPFLGK